jgi:hypothetical protein
MLEVIENQQQSRRFADLCGPPDQRCRWERHRCIAALGAGSHIGTATARYDYGSGTTGIEVWPGATSAPLSSPYQDWESGPNCYTWANV